jgi:cytochrome c553
MRSLSNLALVSWGAVAMLAFSSVSFAEDSVTANLSNGKKIYDNGKPDVNVAACVTCHGENAMGNDDMGSPKLANVGYVYIVKQLTNFAEGKRTDLTMGVMNDIAKGLTEQDRRDLAAYENSQPRVGELSDLKALATGGKTIGQAYKGKALVVYGAAGKVPACQSCHGANGRGADPVYPKIAQQRYVYIVNQLTHWRDGSRANDPIGQMRAVAKNLTDDDINDAATYLSQAADSTPGNGMEIDNRTVMKNVKIVR